MINVLVTGASGQLGRCIKEQVNSEEKINWIFKNSSELDITSNKDLRDFFQENNIGYCINCAAYTNVEKAEEEKESAFLINSEAVKNLALLCKEYNAVLVHISTDYVFDGKTTKEYSEEDKTNPINVYGASKLKGEEYIQNILQEYFIFRTSWLYSQFGHNFYKTILRKASEGAVLNITTAQIGTPTNANHLAEVIVNLVRGNNLNFGLYHFSNEGKTTWFHFAEEILKISGKLEKVELNKDNSYKTVATRPEYSVLSKEKLRKNLNFEIASWQVAVEELYKREVNKS